MRDGLYMPAVTLALQPLGVASAAQPDPSGGMDWGWLLLGAAGCGWLIFWLLNWRRGNRPSTIPASRPATPAARSGGSQGGARENWISLDQTTTVVEEMTDVEEEAEVFMLLGRMDMAIGVLRHHIESHDNAPAHVWMSLLDVLHSQGLRREFEKLAVEIRTRFNIAQPTWEEANARGSGISGLEHFPHLLDRIQHLWGRREALDYLHSLIRNDRKEGRAGFHHEAFRDLLLLIDLLERQA